MRWRCGPWFSRSDALAGAPGLRALTVAHAQWRQVAGDLAATGARLLAIWASSDQRAPKCSRSISGRSGRPRGELPTADSDAAYPGIEDLFPGGRAHAARNGRPVRDSLNRSGCSPVAAARRVAAKLSADYSIHRKR